jgi:hypothetical protein
VVTRSVVALHVSTSGPAGKQRSDCLVPDYQTNNKCGITLPRFRATGTQSRVGSPALERAVEGDGVTRLEVGAQQSRYAIATRRSGCARTPGFDQRAEAIDTGDRLVRSQRSLAVDLRAILTAAR